VRWLAVVGTKYHVETVIGTHYYYSEFFTPGNCDAISKTLLLVDTGSKVRVEEAKDGEGGAMVDK
jgi:hypothetical protein